MRVETKDKKMKVISIIGEKKSGKTSLIECLIAYLKEYGKIGCIKHAHKLDLDITTATAKAKDTERFFNAGAEVVIGDSEERTVKIYQSRGLKDLIDEMATSGVDFVLVEGFKSSNLPKIALSHFPNNKVSNILKRVDFRGNPQMKEEMIKELAQVIRSLDGY